MNLTNLLEGLRNCPCGRVHTFDTETVEIGSGITARTGEILRDSGFPDPILLVADRSTYGAAEAEGLSRSLSAAGYSVKKLIYDDLKYARAEQVREVEEASEGTESVLSVGTGSLNDICRVASFRRNKPFAIFATAPSMDGFASDTAPILEHNFKISLAVRQPRIILADTKILARAPRELKSAGYGDMVAKDLGIAEWRISHLLTGEYYCENVAQITLSALQKVTALTDKVTSEDEEAAGAIMEALVLSGLAMKLALSSRPASGAEHVLSHYWECRKVARGIWPEYHGKKVGVATLLITKIYRNLAENYPEISPVPDCPDWPEIRTHFTPEQLPDLERLNHPGICEEIDRDKFRALWPEIRRILLEDLPDPGELEDRMKRAGCATTPEEVRVDSDLLSEGLRYHGYMRHRVLLTRLLPMLNTDPLTLL